MNTLLVSFNMDNMGTIRVRIIHPEWQKKIDDYMEYMHSIGVIEAPLNSGTEGIFFQEGSWGNIRDFFEGKEWIGLNRGYPVIKDLGEEVVLNFWGYGLSECGDFNFS